MYGGVAVRDKIKRDKTNKKQEGQDNRDRDKSKRKQKAVVGEEGFWEHSLGKRDYDYRWSIQFWVRCCGCLGDKHPRASKSELAEEGTKAQVFLSKMWRQESV